MIPEFRPSQCISLLLLVCASALASGCVEYHIASPEHELILARGVTKQVGRRAQLGIKPWYEHRQFSIVGVPGIYEFFFFVPAGLFFLDGQKFQSQMRHDMSRVAIVARRGTEDFWLSVLTYGLVKSMSVGLYPSLRPNRYDK